MIKNPPRHSKAIIIVKCVSLTLTNNPISILRKIFKQECLLPYLLLSWPQLLPHELVVIRIPRRIGSVVAKFSLIRDHRPSRPVGLIFMQRFNCCKEVHRRPPGQGEDFLWQTQDQDHSSELYFLDSVLHIRQRNGYGIPSL